MMELTQLANLGKFIGGVAVIESLIYVGLPESIPACVRRSLGPAVEWA